ncbi:hypothetical protein BC628DRAFT_1308533 [Trametes gibbosa]|nr:hypothetical protein BC628DRAFT_1308533 [Trametes gibbosa]
MVVFKVILLVLSGTLFASAITPPTPPVSQAKTVYKGQPFEYIVRYLAWLGCVFVLSSAAHATLLLLDATRLNSPLPAQVIPFLCPSNPASFTRLATYSPRFLVGLLLLTSGGLFRLWSYHALGDLFTFEVTVSDAHQLVTRGPYQYLRHPSYTGLTALLLGAQLVHLGEGSYVSECGVDRTWAVVWVWIWQYGSLFGLSSLYRRCRIEDESLKERFGDVWVEYSKRVRYRLLPWVF